MNNYEYIVASLPDICSGWKFADGTPEDYIEQITSQCSAQDNETIAFLQDGLKGDTLDCEFYRKAFSHKNRFIREYFLFDLNVRNSKVRFLNKALGRDAERDVLPLDGGEFEEGGLLEAVLSESDLLTREKGLDDLMWDKIDSLTVFHYFDIDVILGFIAKLSIVERWYRLDETTGKEMFKKLVDEVRGTFKGVEFHPQA